MRTFPGTSLFIGVFIFLAVGVNAQQPERPISFDPSVKTDEKKDQVFLKPGQVEEKQSNSVLRSNSLTQGSAFSNVLVNNNAGASAFGRFTQSTSSLLSFGNNVLISYLDMGSSVPVTNKFTGFAYSTDGGATFTDGGTLPTTSVGDGGYSVLARNSTTGRIYLVTTSSVNQLAILFRSDDNGVTWLPPVAATPGSIDDSRPWITVDNFDGTGNGNVYVVSKRFNGTTPVGIFFYRSTNHGSTFSPGAIIVPGGHNGSFVTVAPDHSIYVFWAEGTVIKMRKSTDQGASFAAPVTVVTGMVETADLGLTGLRQGTDTYAQFFANSFPQAAINPLNGHLYLTYANAGSSPDKADVFFIMSTDGGATWSLPVRVNDDLTSTDQWAPTIAVTPDGQHLGIFYNSRQEDAANNNLFRYYSRVATISGSTVTFTPGAAVSLVRSLPEFGREFNLNTRFMVDYTQATATADGFLVTWTDIRNDFTLGPPRKDPDIYFAKFPVTGPPPTPYLLSSASTITSGNGVINTNECNQVDLSVLNIGTGSATGISAVLSTTTPGVTVSQSNSAYPDIAIDANAINITPFTICTGGGFVCGTPIELTLTIEYEEGISVLSFSLQTGTLKSPVAFHNNTSTPIVDVATTDIPITVSGVDDNIGKVTLTLHLTHTFMSDLDISLVAPDGTIVELSSNNGSSSDGYGTSCSNRTIFDDDAAVSIVNGTAPFAGTFRPESLLSLFNGKSGSSVNGIWTLRIVDELAIDVGNFICATLNIFPAECDKILDVTVNQAAGQADPATTSPVNFTAAFSEPVTGFTSADVTVGGTAGATTVIITEIAPLDGTTYNIAVSGMNANGTVIVSIPADVVQNADNTTNTASTSLDNTINYLLPCEIECPDNVIADATSFSGAVVNYSLLSSGACGTITSLPASGSTFPIGTTTVNAYENYSQKIYALVSTNRLLSFDMATPGTTSMDLTITGLTQAPYFDGEFFYFENIAAIDFRPSNGLLYGLGIIENTGTAQLYTINVTTGVASAVGSIINLAGRRQYSMDFNPVTDELRLIDNFTVNRRINADLGTVISTDASINPEIPISGIAYTNPVLSATSTTLYDLSPQTNSLYYQGSVGQIGSDNTGSLTLVGAVGVDFTLGGFDITQANIGVASLFTTLGAAPLYTIDLVTGASTFIGNINIGAGIFVQDIAAAPIPAPLCSFTVTVNMPQPPTITCPANVTVYASAATCKAQYTILPEHFTVTGGGVTISIDATNGDHVFGTSNLTSTGRTSQLDVSTYIVEATATNAAGSASCSYTITVIDNTPPTIVECPTDITVNSDPGQCSAFVEFGFTVVDNCTEVLYRSYNGVTGSSSGGGPTYMLTLGRTFPVGITTFNAVFSDDYGNSSSCTFTITVLDIEKPVITHCPAPVTVSCASQILAVDISGVTATDNCGTPTISHQGDVISNQVCANKYTVTRNYLATDGSGNTASCSQTITVDDDTPPTITGLTPSKYILSPPNHKMVDVTLAYSINDNCVSIPDVTISITSNEPVNGTGDGDTDPDWQIIDNRHIRLRAERAGNGNGRIYTITVTVDDGCNAPVSATTEVRVTHNITGPHSGNSFKVGTTVTFTGEFWDKPGNKHTAKWLIDGNTTVKASVTEPAGNKNGKVTGSYKFNSPGVYKLQMNTTDQNGITTYANTNGDVDAIVVIYDPNGGNTYGGGYFNSPAGALQTNPSASGKASYGFAMNYFKNSTNPKGETQFEFKVGEFEFNALNFDYLVISNSMAQFKGTGKIIGGQSGIGFTMTVVDGQLDGTGIDKIRMKIYNKNNGEIIYDNQPGSSDAALPVQAVGANSTIVISGVNSNLTKSNTGAQQPAIEVADKTIANEMNAMAYPNPSSGNFSILVTTDTGMKERLLMQIVDLSGRIIESRNINTNTMIRLGDNYRPGTYFVRIIKGKEQKTIKLLKLSD